MNALTLKGGEHAVLLLHGLQSSPAELQPISKRLHEAGYTVHVPHLKGYGFTQGDTPRSVTTWQEWHALALAEFHSLKLQHKSVALGGLCIGATLALSIAADLGDEVSALCLLSTTLWYDGWGIPWYRFLRHIGYYSPFRYYYSYREREPFGLKNKQLRKWIAREMSHHESSIVGASKLNLPAIHEGERMIASVKKTMCRITAPTIIIHAEEDEIASPRNARYVAEHIGSKRVEKVMLHNSYHMITVDNDREQVASEAIRFFNSVYQQQN
jgi:carboxylesterase